MNCGATVRQAYLSLAHRMWHTQWKSLWVNHAYSWGCLPPPPALMSLFLMQAHTLCHIFVNWSAYGKLNVRSLLSLSMTNNKAALFATHEEYTIRWGLFIHLSVSYYYSKQLVISHARKGCVCLCVGKVLHLIGYVCVCPRERNINWNLWHCLWIIFNK